MTVEEVVQELIASNRLIFEFQPMKSYFMRVLAHFITFRSASAELGSSPAVLRFSFPFLSLNHSEVWKVERAALLWVFRGGLTQYSLF